MRKNLGVNQQKILTLLLGGVALGLTRTPKEYFKVIKEIKKEWDWINHQQLMRSLHSLYDSKLVKQIDHDDGTTTMILTEKGENVALKYKVDDMKIERPKSWDKKWRIVLFDVPERLRNLRDSLRDHLRQMEFYELQKSVFAHPYDCRKHFEFLVELYDARRFVRFILANSIDNELALKKHFKLLKN